MKRAWTEGAWEAVPELLYKGSHAAGRTPKVVCGEKAIASVHLPKGAYRKNGPCEEAEANARLIAAAPDMIEALAELKFYLEGSVPTRAHAMMEGAIKKALGEAR